MEGLISAFPFIVQDGPAQLGRPARSTFVRAHVMERYHRERRAKKDFKEAGFDGKVEHHFVVTPKLQWQEVNGIEKEMEKGRKPTTANSKTLKVKKEAVKCDKKDSRTPVEGTKSQIIILERPELYSMTVRNPVREDSARFLRNISTYSRMLDSRSTPFDVMNRVWLPAAFSDPALFHASFSNYSTHVSALTREHEAPASLEHKGLALQQISRRIEFSGKAITDGMIATVLCLVGSELLNEDPSALNAHLKGIRQMIASRGGPEVLGFNGVLKRLYLTYELLFSTVFKNESPPTMEGPPKLFSSGYLPYSTPSGIFTLGKAHIDPTSHGFSADTVRLLSVLCQHLSSSDVFISRSSSPSETLSKVMADLDALSNNSLYPSPETEDHALKALILATTIQFPHLNPSSRPMSLPRKIKQLECHLNQTPLLSFWKPLPGALLWCIVVGATASKGMAERNWFMAILVRMTTGLAFENWESIRGTLEIYGKVVDASKVEFRESSVD